MASRRHASSVWKSSLRLGLLTVPVPVPTAQQEKELVPIHYRKVNAETGQEIPHDRIVKDVILKSHTNLDIEDFVPLEDIYAH